MFQINHYQLSQQLELISGILTLSLTFGVLPNSILQLDNFSAFANFLNIRFKLGVHSNYPKYVHTLFIISMSSGY